MGQHRHAVGDLPQQVEVVRDHHDGQAEEVAQCQHELIDAAGADGIQPRRGLVQKQQLRIQRECTRHRGALHHAAAERRRVQRADLGRQPRHGQFGVGDVVDQGTVQCGVFTQGQTDVFLHRQRAEEPAVLEHHAPALAQCARILFVSHFCEIDPQNMDRARIGLMQKHHLAQQGRLARAAATDQRKNLRALNLEVDVVVHDVAAKAGADLAQCDHGGAVSGVHLRDPAR